MSVTLSPHLRSVFGERDVFEQVFALQGEVLREHKNRRTMRAVLDDHAYFVKVHRATAWREILKNALRFRWPVLTAEPEVTAAARLHELGVPTVRVAGHGTRGTFPHRLESFVITEELSGMMHLDEFTRAWSGVVGCRLAILKRTVMRDLAYISRVIHANGLNHRDYYLNHFMLPDRDWNAWRPDDALDLHVIDLHRMQQRATTPRRWAIKDLSGLLFSAFDAEFGPRDYLRFLEIYFDRPWREVLMEERSFLRGVRRRAVTLYRSEHGRLPQLPDGLTSFA